MLHTHPAVGGDKLQIFWFDFQQARHEVAALFCEVFKHQNLVLKALLGLMAAKGFVNPAIIANAHQGAGGVFYLVHGKLADHPP